MKKLIDFLLNKRIEFKYSVCINEDGIVIDSIIYKTFDIDKITKDYEKIIINRDNVFICFNV